MDRELGRRGAHAGIDGVSDRARNASDCLPQAGSGARRALSRRGEEHAARSGIEYLGYLANLRSPEVYAQSRLALHVPRRQYANGLNGVPTIRVFEVLACGIPLVCSPWADTEGLFRSGQDYVLARNGSRDECAAWRAAGERSYCGGKLHRADWKPFGSIIPAGTVPSN